MENYSTEALTSSFKAAGVVPLNEDVVLKHILSHKVFVVVVLAESLSKQTTSPFFLMESGLLSMMKICYFRDDDTGVIFSIDRFP